MSSRRHFLSASALGLAALATPRQLLAIDADNAYLKDIGIQLYTLRDAIKENPRKVLKQLAKLEYKQVEPYGFPDCDPILDAADRAGLPVRSSHFNANCVIESNDGGGTEFDRILEKAKEIGLSHLVIPYLAKPQRSSLDDYKVLCERFNKAAEKATSAGIQLAYHNHAFEFEPLANGRCGYDVMRDDFSDSMKFEVDVFWVHVAGVDPVELLGKLKGRVSQVHLKDLASSVKIPTYEGVPKEGFEELGDGVVAIEAVMEKAEETGVKHCHVEQDHSPEPMQSVRKSRRYLNRLAG